MHTVTYGGVDVVCGGHTYPPKSTYTTQRTPRRLEIRCVGATRLEVDTPIG